MSPGFGINLINLTRSYDEKVCPVPCEEHAVSLRPTMEATRPRPLSRMGGEGVPRQWVEAGHELLIADMLAENKA